MTPIVNAAAQINKELTEKQSTLVGRLFSLLPSPYRRAYNNLLYVVIELERAKVEGAVAAGKPHLKIFNPEE